MPTSVFIQYMYMHDQGCTRIYAVFIDAETADKCKISRALWGILFPLCYTWSPLYYTTEFHCSIANYLGFEDPSTDSKTDEYSMFDSRANILPLLSKIMKLNMHNIN